MKIILLKFSLFFVFIFVLSFAFIAKASGSDFLVYNLPAKHQLKSYVFKNVFSAKERSFLAGSTVPYNVKKVSIKTDKSNSSSNNSLNTKRVDEFLDYMRTNCRRCKVEKVSSADFMNYTDEQWALKNSGKPQQRWTSDIDSYAVQGVLGEDINIDRNERENKILVAIIDSGIDINHPDLKDKIYQNEAECKALDSYNTCLKTESDKNVCYKKFKDFDANGNGYPLDCHGWSITDKSNPLNDLEGNGNINDLVGHGTHIAGIIGAQRNDIGIDGIIDNVTLLPIQVSVFSKNNTTGVAADKFAKALLYAIKSKAQIVNMSLGWRFDQDSTLMREMIKLAHSKGILIVVAAGNDSHKSESYPCSYDEVICVGSHDINGIISSFSNFGSHIDLLAPGSNILSTWPTNLRARKFTIDEDYEYQSGTSQATPHVAGVLARLLNQGYTPEVARIKLLAGARKKVMNQKSKINNFVRFGNLDYLGALSEKTESLFIPFSKSSSLINWDKEIKSFVVKVKNLSSTSQSLNYRLTPKLDLTQTDFKLESKSFGSLEFQAGEIKELRFNFTSKNDVEGNFVFSLALNGRDFTIQAKALSLINPENPRSDLKLYDLIDLEGFTQGAILREFSDFTDMKTKEFLAMKEIDGTVNIARVKSIEGSYRVSKSIKLPFKESIIINLSKVDVDLNNEHDYVLTFVDLTDRENRVTKFLVLDKNFKPKRIQISPKNTFNNKVTVLPGSFIWLKFQKRMVPAWIALGERPTTEREEQTPWSRPQAEIKKQTMYLQLPEGLKTVKFSKDEELPLHFLYQNESRSKGEVTLITSLGFGFDKTYHLYKFSQKLIDLGPLKLDSHFDLASSKPLPLVNPEGEHAFFNTPSINGAQNILSIDYVSETNKLKIKQFRIHSSGLAPIKFVLSVEGDFALGQTSNRLLYRDTQTVSNTDARRIKHKLLRSEQALFLASNLTPGIGSEVVKLNKATQTLYRPAAFQMLATKGCTEVGFIFENTFDKAVFSCPELKKLIKVRLR